MSSSFRYLNNGKTYEIRFNQINEKIRVDFGNTQYYSKYSLQEIKERLTKETYKIQKYKDITSINEKKKKFKNFDIYKCLKINILSRKLHFGNTNLIFLPSIWKIFPEDNNQNSDVDTFQINLYSETYIYKLLVLYFNENKNQNENNNIQNELSKIPIDFISSKSIGNIKDLNNNINNNEKNNNHKIIYKNVFILKDIDNFDECFMKLIIDEYKEQFFIIIVNENKSENLKLDLGNKLDNYFKVKNVLKEIIDEIKNDFIINNTIIINTYNELVLCLLKLYSYFNQIDDYNFIELIYNHNLLPDKDKEDEKDENGIKKEIDEIYNNEHCINIKICGNSSYGKSAFINTIMGEKRSLTGKPTGTTKKNNIFISKKYQLRLFDDLGFDQGNEGFVNEEFSKLKEEKNKIIIDEDMKLSYGYNEDYRNNIHLLLYFFKYNNPYNISAAHFKYVKEFLDKGIPIIFIINFSDDKIFKAKDEYKDNYLKDPNKYNSSNNYYLKLLDDIQEQLEIKIKDLTKIEKEQNELIEKFKQIPKIPINCLFKKGFNDLFKEIYNIFQKNLVNPDIIQLLEKGENYGSANLDLDGLNVTLKDNPFFIGIKFKDIISVQLKESVNLIKILILKLTGQYSGKSKVWIKFAFSRMWNLISETIGTLWRPHNEFYPLLTDLVSKIYNIFGETKKDEECNAYIKQSLTKYFHINKNGKIEYDDFKRDYSNYRNLFINTEKFYDKKVETDNFLEKGVFTIEGNKFSNIGNFLINLEKNFYDINITNTIMDISKFSKSLSINDDTSIDDGKINLIEKEDIEEKKTIEEISLKETDSISIYKNEFDDIIEKITNYVKKKFGEYNGDKIVENDNDIILLKILFIDIVCKELIIELSKNSRNIYYFYSNLANKYNKAVAKLNDLINYFEKENWKK